MERSAALHNELRRKGGGGGGGRGARKCKDADMKHDAHHQNGGWEGGEKNGLKDPEGAIHFFSPHCSGREICDCYDGKQSAGTTPSFKIAPVSVSVLCSVRPF